MRSGAACVSAALGLSAVTALAEDEPAQFLVLPLLANEVAVLPRLVASDEVSARINNRLAEIDREEKDFAEDCRGAIAANGGWFRIWPSAAEGGLALQPSGLSHADQACADPVAIPPAKFRELGFAVLFTQSLAFEAGGAPAAEQLKNAGK